MNRFKIWVLQVLTKYSKTACTYAFCGSNQSFFKARTRLTLTYLSPKELQAIFDLVIKKGYYLGEKGSEYMCMALDAACSNGVITYSEMVTAKEHIKNYLVFHRTLNSYLENRLLPSTPTARMAIYQNWSARP